MKQKLIDFVFIGFNLDCWCLISGVEIHLLACPFHLLCLVPLHKASLKLTQLKRNVITWHLALDFQCNVVHCALNSS